MLNKINRSKLIYITGAAIIAIAVLLLIIFAVIAGGGGFDRRPKLVFASAEGVKIYDGTPLVRNQYEFLGGKLDSEHSISVTVDGSRTETGVSPNTFQVKITSQSGEDITNSYNIVKQYGDLTVTPRSVSISSSSAHAVYDGKPLTNDEWALVGNNVLNEHVISNVIIGGSQTDVGVSKNYITEVVITDKSTGKNVSYNYEVQRFEGDLIVSPRKITIRSQSDAKNYDGLPLINKNWEMQPADGLVEGHTPKVIISGTQTEVGRSPNTIAQVIISSGSKDVTPNYEIRLQEGSLVVRGQDGSALPEDNPAPSAPRLNTSGDIGGSSYSGEGAFDLKTVEVKVKSEVSGKVYLRLMSFGDYNGRAWTEAPSYSDRILSNHSLNYLSGIALSSIQKESYSINIQSMSGDYLLPYYLDVAPFDYLIQSNDVRNIGNGTGVYSSYYYLWDYIAEGQGLSFDLGVYQSAESKYYQFVIDNYLSLPLSTSNALQNIILSDSKLSSSNNTFDIIKNVAEYIQNSAVYNERYNQALDTSDDIVLSFLNNYKQGVCRHFASAATTMYRAMGLPARYTIGYVGESKAEEWVEIPAKNAHAWVEVYVEGFGWVQVEVTAPGYGNNEDNGGTGSEDNENHGDKQVVRIKPVDVFAQYFNGAILVPSNEIYGLKDFVAKGYTYKAVVTGMRNAVGIGYSTISAFKLYNPNGKDVTNQYQFVFGRGKLQLYIAEITVATISLSKDYDGVHLIAGYEDYKLLEGSLINGHSWGEGNVTGKQLLAGQSDNVIVLKIMDSSGTDVTDLYKINMQYGKLIVEPKPISIFADSITQTYTGTEVSVTTYSYDPGDLVDGDIVYATVKGAQTERGSSSTWLEDIKILNKNGIDVTNSYAITSYTGTIEVR